MLAVTAGSTDENTRTKVKKVMIATSLAGALIAKNQVDDCLLYTSPSPRD